LDFGEHCSADKIKGPVTVSIGEGRRFRFSHFSFADEVLSCRQ
jgi:hypothetical protein